MSYARLAVFILSALSVGLAQAGNINELNQQFNQPGAGIAPWMFIPKSNIKEISTSEHPRMVLVRQAGKRQDIKGILQKPIKVTDYPIPWEFHLGLAQTQIATQGVGGKVQDNLAYGLNVAVTYSDPATWPKDRNQRPADTQDFQLLLVHLGDGPTGEFNPGLPQYMPDNYHENFLLWGRGSMGQEIQGDWELNFLYLPGGISRDGLASQQAIFKCTLSSSTTLEVGYKETPMQAFYSRNIKLARPITGIWEIGPIFSCDRWIPDVLCPALPVNKNARAVPPEPPEPIFEYYVDYCTFFGLDSASWPTYSDDFNVSGDLENMQTQSPYQLETWSHPGYMTETLFGPSQTAGFANSLACYPKLDKFKPPWEIEICFNTLDDNIPWNFHYFFYLLDVHKQWHWWTPGVQNVLTEKRHFFFNNAISKSSLDINNDYTKYNMNIVPFQLEFDPPVPEKILAAKPLYWLFQMIDASHMRMAFKAKPAAPWYFSKIYAMPKGIDAISEFGCIMWNTLTGRHFHIPPGSPMYQQILIDYIHYRYGLSK